MTNRGYDLTDEKDVQRYLQDIETEYQFQCIYEKQPDGCHRLAEFHGSIRRNPELCSTLLKENCDNNNYAFSCYKYGQYLLAGMGLPDNKPDHPAALKYSEKSCELNNGDGCFLAGELLASDRLGPDKNTDKAMAMYAKACELKHGEACAKLSFYHLTGKHVQKDLPRAYELARTGCDFNEGMACHNLSLMYRHGHGTPKNSVLADQTKDKAIHLSAEAARKQKELKVNQ